MSGQAGAMMLLAAALLSQGAGADDPAQALERERAEWLADKRSDPLDLAIEPEAERTRRAADAGDCRVASDLAFSILARHPFQLGALDVLARCGSGMAASKAAARRDAIVALIAGSGRGDIMRGWKVISWTEPFEFLRLRGLRAEEWQVGCERTQHVRISTRDPQGKIERWVFDINPLYRACRSRVACPLERRQIPCRYSDRL